MLDFYHISHPEETKTSENHVCFDFCNFLHNNLASYSFSYKKNSHSFFGFKSTTWIYQCKLLIIRSLTQLIVLLYITQVHSLKNGSHAKTLSCSVPPSITIFYMVRCETKVAIYNWAEFMLGITEFDITYHLIRCNCIISTDYCLYLFWSLYCSLYLINADKLKYDILYVLTYIYICKVIYI